MWGSIQHTNYSKIISKYVTDHEFRSKYFTNSTTGSQFLLINNCLYYLKFCFALFFRLNTHTNFVRNTFLYVNK